MIRRALLTGLLICLSASFLFAKPGVVKTKDGRTIEGDVTDNGVDGVTIATKVASVTIRATDVASIEYASDIKELYKQRLAKLPPTAGAQSHFELARWLYDVKEYDLAQKELDAALAIDPNHSPSALLKQTVERSHSLDHGPADATSTARPPAATTKSPAPAGSRKDRHLLDPDQINVVRQNEIRDTDRAVRVRLDNDVRKHFVEYDNRDPAEFARLSDYEKAIAILRRGTDDMRKDVKFLSDPPAITDFKAKVQPMIMVGCATVACHGGGNAGSFMIYNPADSDAVTYTNFYIITQYTREIDGVKRKAIDRLQPRNSILAQFCFPRDKSEIDHPDVRGWTHLFKSEQDQRYQNFIRWIGELVSVEPKYPDNFFPLPGAGSEKKEPEKEQSKPAAQPPKANADRGDQNKNANKDTGETVDEARQRIKPINPGTIQFTIPF